MQSHWALPLEGHFTSIHPFFIGSIYISESHPGSYTGRTEWAGGRLRNATSIWKKKKKNTQPNKKPLSQPPNNPNLQNPQTYPNDFSKYNSECRMDPTWDGSSNHSQQYIQPLGLVQSQDSCVRHSREIFFLQEMESCKFSLERCRTWNSPDSGCSLGFE